MNRSDLSYEVDNPKHTPGPWSASFYPGEPITGMIQPGRRQDEWHIDPPAGDRSNGVAIVASVHGLNMKNNARLIAAAPDMLAALQQMAKAIGGTISFTPNTLEARMILAAITRATKGNV